MKAEEIQPGDVFTEKGEKVYTVESVRIMRPHIVAAVRYVDGGSGERMWEIGKDAPLAHP